MRTRVTIAFEDSLMQTRRIYLRRSKNGMEKRKKNPQRINKLTAFYDCYDKIVSDLKKVDERKKKKKKKDKEKRLTSSVWQNIPFQFLTDLFFSLHSVISAGIILSTYTHAQTDASLSSFSGKKQFRNHFRIFSSFPSKFHPKRAKQNGAKKKKSPNTYYNILVSVVYN